MRTRAVIRKHREYLTKRPAQNYARALTVQTATHRACRHQKVQRVPYQAGGPRMSREFGPGVFRANTSTSCVSSSKSAERTVPNSPPRLSRWRLGVHSASAYLASVGTARRLCAQLDAGYRWDPAGARHCGPTTRCSRRLLLCTQSSSTRPDRRSSPQPWTTAGTAASSQD